MKNTLLVGSIILVLAILTISGCLWVPVDDGYGGRDSHDGGRGGPQGERHDNRNNHR